MLMLAVLDRPIELLLRSPQGNECTVLVRTTLDREAQISSNRRLTYVSTLTARIFPNNNHHHHHYDLASSSLLRRSRWSAGQGLDSVGLSVE